MDTVKIGFIGVGAAAVASHIPAFLQDKRVSVTALCDIDRKRALAARKKYFKNAAVYEDYMDLLADDNVEVVDICAPNYLHAQIAAEAFRAGKHVICACPGGIGVEDMEKAYAASLGANKMLLPIREERFNENALYLKNLIEKARMGDLYSVQLVSRKKQGVPGAGSWRTSRELSGGGVLMADGLPMLDLAWFLMGQPEPDTVCCDMLRALSEPPADNGSFDVEDTAVGTVKFKNGVILRFDFAWASFIERDERYMQLLGTRAGAVWDGSKDCVCSDTPKGKRKVHWVNRNDIIPETQLALSRAVDVLLGKAEPVFTPKDAAALMRIVGALYESAANNGQQVKFA